MVAFKIGARSIFITCLIWFTTKTAQATTGGECCQTKVVGGVTYYLINSDDYSTIRKYNCKDSCVYTDSRYRARFCFKRDNAGGKPASSCPLQSETTYPNPNYTTESEETVTNQARTCQCGQENTRNKIVGGTETIPYQFPWQVGLKLSGDRLPFCGGSLISDQEILTAAHCVSANEINDFYVVLGVHNASSPPLLKATVCQIFIHPAYDVDSEDYDFAILKLCDRITNFTREISPVCLPTSSGRGAQYEGVRTVVSGWGNMAFGGSQPDKLRKVEVFTMENSVCCGPSYGYYCSTITPRMICAENEDVDACQGDSGGPLVYQEDSGFYTLIGVVSFGKGCAMDKFPGVYSRVTYELNWIRSKIGGSICEPELEYDFIDPRIAGGKK